MAGNKIDQFTQERQRGERGYSHEELELLKEFYNFLNPPKTPFATDVLESLFGAWDHKPENQEKILYHNKRGYRTSITVGQVKATIQEKYDLWHNAVG